MRSKRSRSGTSISAATACSAFTARCPPTRVGAAAAPPRPAAPHRAAERPARLDPPRRRQRRRPAGTSNRRRPLCSRSSRTKRHLRSSRRGPARAGRARFREAAGGAIAAALQTKDGSLRQEAQRARRQALARGRARSRPRAVLESRVPREMQGAFQTLATLPGTGADTAARALARPAPRRQSAAGRAARAAGSRRRAPTERARRSSPPTKRARSPSDTPRPLARMPGGRRREARPPGLRGKSGGRLHALPQVLPAKAATSARTSPASARGTIASTSSPPSCCPMRTSRRATKTCSSR